MEDAIQPLLLCTKAPSQPLEATHNDVDHSIFYADLHGALINERVDIEEAKTIPK